MRVPPPPETTYATYNHNSSSGGNTGEKHILQILLDSELFCYTLYFFFVVFFYIYTLNRELAEKEKGWLAKQLLRIASALTI